jgi:hypothetical protein
VFKLAVGAMDDQRLARLARRERVFRSYASSYTVSDVAAKGKTLAGNLSNRAPAAVRQQVRLCQQTVTGSRQESVLPAFGALGTVAEERALVLGFAWSDKPSGSLSRYMLWVWPRGSCDAPLNYRSGQIRR